MFKSFALMSVTGLTLASVTEAQQAIPCDWIARADAIVEPWRDNTRTFANGDVRLALLDAIEPGAGSLHILILSPPFGEQGERQCMTLGMSDHIGFTDADFSSLESGYDPSLGLIFDMDIQTFDGDEFRPGHLHFTLNQATGKITSVLR